MAKDSVCWVLVAHTCNPTSQEANIRQPGQTVHEILKIPNIKSAGGSLAIKEMQIKTTLRFHLTPLE
jgi:hypothetical protein